MEIDAITPEAGALGFMESFVAEHAHFCLWEAARSASPLDEFATSLAELFLGNPDPPSQPAVLTEPCFSLEELCAAILKLKPNKENDDAGWVPELLQYAPDGLLSDLLLLFNDVLYSGDAPSSWLIRHFIMLPKSGRAKTTGDFKPIARVRMFFTKFLLTCYLRGLILRLKLVNRKSNMGFVQTKRYLITANLVVDNFLQSTHPCGSSVWICQKRSTELIGTNYGLHSSFWTMAFLNTLCGSFSACN